MLLLLVGLIGVVQADELKPVKLTWYYPGSPQPDQDKVFAKANEIIKEKINATVDFKVVGWGSYEQKMKMIMASGEKYDLCFTSNWMNNYYQNVARGAFVPLNDLMAEYAPGLKSMVPDKMWRATKVDGKIYGLINYQISAMTNGFSIMKEYADKYNLDTDALNSPESIEPFLEKIKQNEPNKIPYQASPNNGGNWAKSLVYYGFIEVGGRNIPGAVKIEDDETNVVNQYKTEEFKEFVDLMHDWYQKGYIARDQIAVKDDNVNRKAGKVIVSLEGNVKPGGAVEASARFGFDMIAVPFSDSVLLNSSIISTMHAISTTSDNSERAMMLMELMNTDKELYNLITFGIEGEHYNKIGENRIEPVKDSGYNPGTPWLHASTFNAYLLPGQPEDVWEETKELNMNAKPSPLLGFTFNPDPVSSEIAQCQSVIDEYLPGLITGTVDPDNILPQFVKKLEGAGANDLIAEMQKQIDEWKANK